MTTHSAQYPSWGILVKASPEHVKQTVSPLHYKFAPSEMRIRASGEWTAVFYMEPSDTGDDDAAQLLRAAGFVPVYFFDFWKQEYFMRTWNGHEWEFGGSPAAILAEVGIEIPGHDGASALDPGAAIIARRASVIQGASVEETFALVPELGIDAHAGPMGTVVYGPTANLQSDLAERAPGRVFEVLYYPMSDYFEVAVVVGETCIGTYRPGETRTWDGTPFLDNIEGETEPSRILEKFGIPRSFLAPLPDETEGT